MGHPVLWLTKYYYKSMKRNNINYHIAADKILLQIYEA